MIQPVGEKQSADGFTRRVDPLVRRRGAVYGIPAFAVDAGRPIVGQVVVGYIGKTRQTVKQREEQHRACQPFGDLIVGGSWVIEEGCWTDAELDAREQYYIRNGAALVAGQPKLRPVYNYEHNLDNPQRIEIWRAVEQRQMREPGWTPPPKGAPIPVQRGPRTYRQAVRPRRFRVRWTPRRVRFAWWSAAWFAVALPVGCWVAASEVATASDGVIAGPVTSTSVLCGWLLYSRQPRRRSRRRTSRRGRR